MLSDASPQTPLAAAQTVWRDACGDAIAAEARPVTEREGVITVACRSATWASELDLMQAELLERLNELLPERPVKGASFHRRRGPFQRVTKGLPWVAVYP